MYFKNEKLSKAYNELKQHMATKPTENDDLNLERIRQALEYLAITHKNELESSSFKHQTFSNDLKLNLNEIIRELENISSNHAIRTGATSSSFYNSFIQQQNQPSGTNLEYKLIEQNRELLNAFKKVSDEKNTLRNLINKMEEELWMHRNRSKQSSENALTDSEREKFKKLYYKYLRAESFRKSLVYQKRFLLIMLSGYEETEREILATLKIESSSVASSKNQANARAALTNANNKIISTYQNNCSIYSNRFTLHKAKSRFRTGVICVIAISRIK